MYLLRVATVREKYLENKVFSRSGKSLGIFVDCQGNLERTWNFREKSGNLKINGYGRQTLEICLLFSSVEGGGWGRCTFS